jgi:hypothetical protein
MDIWIEFVELEDLVVDAIVLCDTYHSRFIPEGVAEASQIFETPTFYQND